MPPPSGFGACDFSLGRKAGAGHARQGCNRGREQLGVRSITQPTGVGAAWASAARLASLGSSAPGCGAASRAALQDADPAPLRLALAPTSCTATACSGSWTNCGATPARALCAACRPTNACDADAEQQPHASAVDAAATAAATAATVVHAAAAAAAGSLLCQAPADAARGTPSRRPSATALRSRRCCA